MREFKKWSPSMNVIPYYGSARERENLQDLIADDDEYDVIITTYNIANMKNDRIFLKQIDFECLILGSSFFFLFLFIYFL